MTGECSRPTDLPERIFKVCPESPSGQSSNTAEHRSFHPRDLWFRSKKSGGATRRQFGIFKGRRTRYGEPSGCCGAGTRSWTLWVKIMSATSPFFPFSSRQRIGNRIFKRVTYWPSCRMLSLIDGWMDGEERELGTSGRRGSARAHSVCGISLIGRCTY